jgi:hypothetical protein
MAVIDELMDEFAHEDGFFLGLHQRQFDPVAAERTLQILKRIEIGADHGANYLLIDVLYHAQVELNTYAYYNHDNQKFNEYNSLLFDEIVDRFDAVRKLGQALNVQRVTAMLESRGWRKHDGATDAAIEKLWSVAPSSLPQSYFTLLSSSNGGEGDLPVQPWWFALDSAEDAAEAKRSGTFKKFFPGFFVIGSNGAGEAIAFDLRLTGSRPIVAVDMTNIDLDESVLPIAPDFDAFIEMIGLSGD